MALFRKQAQDNQYDKLLGEVSISQPLSYKVMIYTFVIFVSISISFLCFAKYNQKQTVTGYLLPTKGVIKNYSPGSVYVSKVFIKEGQAVTFEQPMFELEYRHTTNAGVDVNKALFNEISNQLKILLIKKRNTHQLYSMRSEEINQIIKEIDSKIISNKLQVNHLLTRKKLTKKRVEEYYEVEKKGYIASYDVDKQQDLLLVIEQEIITLYANDSQLNHEKVNQTLALERLPIEESIELQSLLLTESTKRNQLTELEGESTTLIFASTSGRVSALNIIKGQLLKPQQYMVSILPEGAELYAELLVPTRAIGFIREGQTTRIKLDAFPYQKFGMLEAKIFQTTLSVILPKEVDLPIKFDFPVYKIKAQLKNQFINVYGENKSLQAGMIFQADILVDTRSLAEWLFEPLYSLTG